MTYSKRQATPGARFITNDPQAGTVRLSADDQGLVGISTEAEARAADRFGLPAWHKPSKKAPAAPAPVTED